MKKKTQSVLKVRIDKNVLEAAKERIALIFDHFPRICVSFSGGKDSTVMTHLVMEEAIARGRRVGLLFIDWEAQMKLTIDHVRDVFEIYKDHVEPYWTCLPFTTENACSMHEPEWVCWDEAKRDLWVRPIPAEATITLANPPSYYTYGMKFEEFVPEFGNWYGQGEPTACFVGIRSTESLNRFRTLRAKKSMFQDLPWTTWLSKFSYNVYPLYDWETEDIWTYLGKTGKPYNRLYDRMYQAGLSLHQQRICEPFGSEQRRGLWLYQIVEPETWAKVAGRVAGANSGALYSRERGNVMGNNKIELPDGYTWKQFAMFLLDTMPPDTAEHYRGKIAVYLKYCLDNYGYLKSGDIPDFQENDTGSKDIPSWRRICRCLLRNDYWCRSLSFSPTKSANYEAYRKLMRKRRDEWNLI